MVRTRMPGGVGGAAREGPPYPEYLPRIGIDFEDHVPGLTLSLL